MSSSLLGLLRLGGLALGLQMLTRALGKGTAASCSVCHPQQDDDCYNAEFDNPGPCFSAGSERQCLDSGGTYCVEDRSCEDCMAKGMNCFHKNWAVPCYEAGWKKGCEKLGSEFCGKAVAEEAEDAASNSAPDEHSSQGAEPVLQWVLVATTVFVVFLSVLILWYRSGKPAEWNVNEPMDPKTLWQAEVLQDRAKGLGEQLENLSGQKLGFLAGLRRTFLESRAARCKRQRQRLLAKTALAAAGGPPYWSITVQQLVGFHDQHTDDLEAYCACHSLGEKGAHIFLENPESFTGKKLVPNMHVLVKRVIKPLTGVDHEGILGMWALLSGTAPQKARTFISHCWNERFSDFVSTLQHRKEDERIWICSFALPQNMDISSVLGNKPSKSPFAEALKSADFVDVAVDANIEPPKRAWCCFELYLANLQGKTVSILCPRKGTPEKTSEMYEKVKLAMMNVDIRECGASNPEDRDMIMKEIGGKHVKVKNLLKTCAERQASFASHITGASSSEHTATSAHTTSGVVEAMNMV